MPLVAPIDLYFFVIITIVRLTSWFPYRTVRIAVARVLGGLSYGLSRSKRAAMKRAVTAAFGGRLDDRELARILKGSFFDLWLEVLGSKPNRIDAEATTKARIIGWEHLEHALAAGKGVILWENSSFGRRFWSKQILDHNKIRVHQIHSLIHLGGLASHGETWVRQRVIRPFFDDAERSYVTELILLPSTGNLAYGRKLLQRLQENAVICIAGDGLTGAKTLSVPFLGAKYQFSTGMVSLARTSGAAIVPILCLETDDGNASLILEEAIRVGEEDNRERQVERIISQYAALMECYIHRYPGSYRNWHMAARVHDGILRKEERLRRPHPQHHSV